MEYTVYEEMEDGKKLAIPEASGKTKEEAFHKYDVYRRTNPAGHKVIGRGIRTSKVLKSL